MLCATGILSSSFSAVSYVILWAMMCVASRVHPWNCFLQYRSQCCSLFWKHQRCVHHVILAINIEHCMKRFVIRRIVRQPLKSLRAASFSTLQAMLPIGSYFHPCFSCAQHSAVCLHTSITRLPLNLACPTPQQFIRSWFSSSFSSPLLNQKRSLWQSESRLRSAVCVMEKIQ